MKQICLAMPVRNSEILSQIYDHMNYADVILTCSDSAINQKPVAHKVVLSSCSPFLKVLLEANTDSHELIIPDVTTSTMIHILQLIYTGEVRVGTEGDISEVVEGINILGIHSVVNEIQFNQVKKDRSRIMIETQMPGVQDNWTTSSQLISPISEDNSNCWTDTGSEMEVVLKPQENKKTVPKTEMHKSTGQCTNKKRGQQQSSRTVKKVKRRAIHRDNAENTYQGPTVEENSVPFIFCQTQHDLSNPTLFENVDSNFIPVYTNEFNELVFLQNFDNAVCDPEQMDILTEDERLLLLQQATLKDHCYASNKQKSK